MLRHKRLHSDQRGITLVELLVVVVLIGLISLGLTTTILQTFNVSARSSNRMVAVRQVQQAGKQVSNDVLQSQTVTPHPDSETGFPLILTWRQWDETLNHVTYDITPDNELKRTAVLTPLVGESTTIVLIIARYIDASYNDSAFRWRTYCHWNPGLRVLYFRVTAKVAEGPRGAVETREYEINSRIG